MTNGGYLRYLYRRLPPVLSEAASILALNRDLDKVNMKLPSAAPVAPMSRPLSHAVAIVRTEMGRRRPGRRPLEMDGAAAVRARRAAARLHNTRRLTGLHGAS